MNLICEKCRRPVTPANIDFTFGKTEWSNGYLFWPGDADCETRCCGEPVVKADGAELSDDELDALLSEGRRLSEEAGL